MDYGLHDSRDDALQEARTEAARYKAERDIARQELDRLREAGDGAGFSYCPYCGARLIDGRDGEQEGR